MERLAHAPVEVFQRVHPRWMVERMREQSARAALEGKPEQLDWLIEAEDRIAAVGGADAAHGGALRILDVRVLDAAGAVVESVASGADVTIELRYQAAEPVESPMFGVGIHEPGGLLLAAPNSSASRTAVGSVSGEGIARLTIAALPLTPGVYPLSVSAMSHSGERLFDYHDRRYRLRVVAGGALEILGRVRLDVTWDVRPGR
jgi:hypothetical protein